MMISSGDKAVSQIVELDQAMDQIASGNFVLGEYHFILTLYADSQERLSRNIATVRAELSNAGFVSAKEDLAVVSSFYSQFPGNWKYRTRLANVSSLNFLGLSPLHNFATGKKDRKRTRLNPVTNAHLVCRLLLEKTTLILKPNSQYFNKQITV